MGQNAAVSVVGGGDAAGVIDDFLKQNARGELLVATGFASAFGLGWLHQRTRRRPVRLLIGDLRTGFDRWSDDDRKAALAFLSREDVSVRGCYAPDGMLHSKVWVALDPEGSDRPDGVLLGSANLTRQGLFKNDETVARAAPEEYLRIRNELTHSLQRSWDAKAELLIRLGQTANDIGELRAPRRRRRLRGSGRSLLSAAGWFAVAAVALVVGILVLAVLLGVLSDLTSTSESSPAEPVTRTHTTEVSATEVLNVGAGEEPGAEAVAPAAGPLRRVQVRPSPNRLGLLALSTRERDRRRRCRSLTPRTALRNQARQHRPKKTPRATDRSRKL